MTLPRVKDKKVTYSNSSLKLLKERKCATESIPVRSYKKVLVFLMAKTLKSTANLSLRLENEFPQGLILFKANASFYSNISQYSRVIKQGL